MDFEVNKIKVYERQDFRLVAEFQTEEKAREYFNPEYYVYKNFGE